MQLANAEILMYVLGWQGGTVHQVAEVLREQYEAESTEPAYLRAVLNHSHWIITVLDADARVMRGLCVLSQRARFRYEHREGDDAIQEERASSEQETA